MQGLVTKSTGSWYTVETIQGETYQCKIRGAFRLKESDVTNPVVVGDHIEFSILEDGKGMIEQIGTRKNYIIRKSKKLSKQSQILASNIDRALLICTIASPRTSTGFIDRFLVTAEAYSIPVTLVFNKSDLLNETEKEDLSILKTLYSSIGYDSIVLSALDPEQIKSFRKTLNQGTHLFSGHSGVGKSTLLNGLNPDLLLRTTNISKTHQRGQHTTTFAEMYRIDDNLHIIDTPGIREFGMYDFDKAEVSHYFPEMRALLNKCRFDNCLHINEPGCAVKQAIENGTIAVSRYVNYLSIIANEDVYN